MKLLGDGVVVAPSTITGAGLGLFTTSNLSCGECITSMDGIVFGGTNAPQKHMARGYPHSHFCTLLNGTLWLDGFHTPNPPDGIGGGSFANDNAYEGDTVRFQRHKNNAEFRQVYDGLMPGIPVMFLFATRDIQANEEIFVSYGVQYWTGPLFAQNGVRKRNDMKRKQPETLKLMKHSSHNKPRDSMQFCSPCGAFTSWGNTRP